MNEIIGAVSFLMCSLFALYVSWAIHALSKQDVTLANNALETVGLIEELNRRIIALEAKEPKP